MIGLTYCPFFLGKFNILSISLSILLLYAFFNFDFIFYVIRFSRLLALPLVWLFGNYYPRLFYDKFVVTVSVGTFALLILTQFIMIGYLPKFFS